MSNDLEASKTVYYVPAGINFASSLANAILSGDLPTLNGVAPTAFDLPRWTVLLPTRRATRTLSQAFIEQGDGQARLLPQIQPLGDVDEDQLDFHTGHMNGGTITGAFAPDLDAISKLERQFLLLGFIQQWAKDNGSIALAQTLNASGKKNFDLAHSLAELVDGFETHGQNLADIDNLFDGEFAEHRLQLLDFLSIIKDKLPAALKDLGKVGGNDQRNILMRSYTDWLAQESSTSPIIAAGSTGSIPATAKLLSVIASLENGCVVLPGLDVEMDDESWQVLQEHHPQFGMRELLHKMSLERGDVLPLPGLDQSPQNTPKTKARNWLVSEIMRPAETTNMWREVVVKHKDKLKLAAQDLTVLGLENERDQAKAISLIMRHALETKKSVALITPDRTLARNVKSELGRWKIEVDDSAGEPLSKHPAAVLLLLLLDVAKSQFSAIKLKALLSHRLVRFGLPYDELAQSTYNLEISCLRNRAPYEGLQGFNELCQKAKHLHKDDPYPHPLAKKLNEEDWHNVSEFSTTLCQQLSPLVQLFNSSCPVNLTKIAQIHLAVAEQVCAKQGDESQLWQGDAGEQLSSVFGKLFEASNHAPDMNGHDYFDLLERLLQETMLRPKHARHAQLTIYGLMEARLVASDIVILGGLNENNWPMAAQNNPWLTRPQLRQAGLPVPERRIGLSAHDFTQGFCGDTVFLTYAKKLGNSPAVPSRWILRLRALLAAANMSELCESNLELPWIKWTENLDASVNFDPCVQPDPKPPVSQRAHRFSVTGIEKLLKNPYSHFAEKILKLSPLDPIDRQIGAAERGSLVHDVLQQFSLAYPDDLPRDGEQVLINMFQTALDENIADHSLRAFWQPQLKRMASWFISNEVKLRQDQIGSKVETSGSYKLTLNLQEYSINARADRIDILNDGSLRIIDYKTGMLPSFKQTAQGFSPQLILEALIAQHGGFKGMEKASASNLMYIKLSGGVPPGSTMSLSAKLDEHKQMTQDGLLALLGRYQSPEQGYLANPAPERPDAEREFDYLSRWREWAHLYDGSAKP